MSPYRATAEAMDTDGASTSGGGAGAGAGLGHSCSQGQVPVQAQNLENAWSMLLMARQLIDQGKPSVVHQMVMVAIRSRGGEDAVLQTLQRARELYRNKVRENAAAGKLASLFAECAIAEAQPQETPPQLQPFDANAPTTLPSAVANDTSILVCLLGREQFRLSEVWRSCE